MKTGIEQFVNNCPFEIFNTVWCFWVMCNQRYRLANVVTESIVKICNYLIKKKKLQRNSLNSCTEHIHRVCIFDESDSEARV